MSSIAGIGQCVEINRPGQTPQKVYPVMDPRGTITKQLQSDGITVQAAKEDAGAELADPGETSSQGRLALPPRQAVGSRTAPSPAASFGRRSQLLPDLVLEQGGLDLVAGFHPDRDLGHGFLQPLHLY